MDARIEGQYTLRESMKVANLAIQCLSVEPRFRPKMDEVVRALEELQDSEDRAGGVGSSRDQTARRSGHSSSSSGPRQHRGRQHETTRKWKVNVDFMLWSSDFARVGTLYLRVSWWT